MAECLQGNSRTRIQKSLEFNNNAISDDVKEALFFNIYYLDNENNNFDRNIFFSFNYRTKISMDALSKVDDYFDYDIGFKGLFILITGYALFGLHNYNVPDNYINDIWEQKNREEILNNWLRGYNNR
ncbi:MAG: hypothetical protein FWG29_05680 [Treponema sp.]|nr:hypothetical protein [Treponema sp.]